MEYFADRYWITLNMMTALFLIWNPAESVKGEGSCVPKEMTVPIGSKVNVTCSLGDHMSSCQVAFFRGEMIVSSKNIVTSNSTTVEIKAVAGTNTVVCKEKCGQSTMKLVCGIDIFSGNPPDVPTNLRCIQYGQYGNVICTWEKGRHTHIKTKYYLWLKNNTHSLHFKEENKNNIFGSAHISEHLTYESNYTAWVNVSNKIGEVTSGYFHFTLSDIVKPYLPNISEIEINCTSFTNCSINWKHQQEAHHYKLRYRIFNTSSSYMEEELIESPRKHDLYNLMPFTWYEFQTSRRFQREKGLWSDWSNSYITRTPEGVPTGMLDVWCVLDSTDKTSALLLWKTMNLSEARGIILGYYVSSEGFTWWTNNTSYVVSISKSPQIYAVSASNSVGNSMPSNISIATKNVSDFPVPRNVSCESRENSIHVKWHSPTKTNFSVTGYVVEWEELHNQNKLARWWKTLSADDNSTTISDNIRPSICYRINVYAVTHCGAGVAVTTQGFSMQKAPLSSPVVSCKAVAIGMEYSILLSWKEVPPQQQMGCIIRYKIYVKKQTDVHPLVYGVEPTTFEFLLDNVLPKDVYLVTVTASTKAGESPKGKQALCFTQEKPADIFEDYLKVAVIATFMSAVLLACICFMQSLRERVQSTCYNILPIWCMRGIPDPANCTWAKDIKHEMRLIYSAFPSDSLSSNDEPETMEVEEISADEGFFACNDTEETIVFDHEPNSDKTDFQEGEVIYWQKAARAENQLDSTNSAMAEQIISYKHQMPYTYKSIMSEEMAPDQTAMNIGIAMESMNITVDYLPSNLLPAIDSAEEDYQPTYDSLPGFSISAFPDPMSPCKGTLTLDAVKIDFSSFLE
ncbi:interleukin-12 receptor subunit beta-2 [Protopterus annectens]|uniref:interleukin-12 receptor subunit beta-2 n=1 Tax=Protopterus annectens TaxID=7888 RepID=UPI001CFB3CF5|nr:interleukin-12 receptor subunit beta-2 [Protopterus annectens]